MLKVGKIGNRTVLGGNFVELMAMLNKYLNYR